MKLHDLALDILNKASKEDECETATTIKFPCDGSVPQVITSITILLEKRDATSEEIAEAFAEAKRKGIEIQNGPWENV